MEEQAYAIMRNTRTLESHRAWARSTASRGQPLIAAAFVPLILGGVVLGKALIRGHSTGFLAGAILLSVAALLLALGQILIALRRKSHPWVAPG